jgi:hypothetical protein
VPVAAQKLMVAQETELRAPLAIRRGPDHRPPE